MIHLSPIIPMYNICILLLDTEVVYQSLKTDLINQTVVGLQPIGNDVYSALESGSILMRHSQQVEDT
jgi:hypothetical protein